MGWAAVGAGGEDNAFAGNGEEEEDEEDMWLARLKSSRPEIVDEKDPDGIYKKE